MSKLFKKGALVVLAAMQLILSPVKSSPDKMNSGEVSVENVVAQVAAINAQKISDPGTEVTSVYADSVFISSTAGKNTKQSSTAYVLSHEGLKQLESTYPTGTYYGPDCYYMWRANSVYRGGYGCAGFAYMLSDAVFGDEPAVKLMGNSDVQKYDCIELFNNEHTAFVLSVNLDGTVTVAEGNVNQKVVWGSTYLISDISAVIRR